MPKLGTGKGMCLALVGRVRVNEVSETVLPAPSAAPEVAIFDISAATGIAFIRSLGRAGVRMRLFTHERVSAGRFSRYQRGAVERCPSPERPDEFSPWLREAVQRGRIEMIAPTSDAIAFHASEQRDVLPRAFSNVAPERESILDCLFKDRFDAACRNAGFVAPPAVFPSSFEDAMSEGSQLRFPVVIKPRLHLAVGSTRGTLAQTPRELRRKYRPYTVSAAGTRLLSRHPEIRLPIIQSVVGGARARPVSVSGLLSDNSELVVGLGSIKRAQWPPGVGIGSEFGCWRDDEIQDQAIDLVKQVLGRGLFELELIFDEREPRRWYALDLNPRAHGFISLDCARGADLPLLWYLTSLGRPLPEVHLREDLRWVHGLPHFIGRLSSIFAGPHRRAAASTLFAEISRPPVDVVFDRTDPLASAVYVGRLLRHPGSLVRPGLRATPL
ncbi:MAG: hypothetical protein HY791_17730 [Deltaproteobacteria bacterium]|nr:hypothetical protein [Deltaproteobacteria bacterium]